MASSFVREAVCFNFRSVFLTLQSRAASRRRATAKVFALLYPMATKAPENSEGRSPGSGATLREEDEAATVSGGLAGASEEKGGKGETGR